MREDGHEEGGMPRGLSPEAFEQIECNFYRGLTNDEEVRRLIETIRVQRRVLETLFSYWHYVPLRIISVADTVRTATLDELKRMVYMDRPKGTPPEGEAWKT